MSFPIESMEKDNYNESERVEIIDVELLYDVFIDHWPTVHSFSCRCCVFVRVHECVLLRLCCYGNTGIGHWPRSVQNCGSVECIGALLCMFLGVSDKLEIKWNSNDPFICRGSKSCWQRSIWIGICHRNTLRNSHRHTHKHVSLVLFLWISQLNETLWFIKIASAAVHFQQDTTDWQSAQCVCASCAVCIVFSLCCACLLIMCVCTVYVFGCGPC